MSGAPERIADALVLVFTAGVSLREWETSGLLEREWALYEALLERGAYGRVVLVTCGGEDDLRIGHGLTRGATVVCAGAEGPCRAGAMSDRVLMALDGARTAAVKTNQMHGGGVAVGVAAHLRGAGVRVGVVARGGYPWSRTVGRREGFGSAAAAGAAREEGDLCRAADVVVGTTAGMVEDLAWRYGLGSDRTAVVPNYVLESAEPRFAAERDGGRSAGGELTVLYAGRLSAEKRVGLLLEGVAGLKERLRARVTVDVIGEGPEAGRLKDLAAGLGVRARFERRMPHRALLERMRRCTVYAQVSAYEGHPKTVLEAMSVGSPVLVADSPGLGEVVDNGVTGMVAAGEAADLAHRFEQLLCDGELRERVGRAAAAEVRGKLGLGRVVELEMRVQRRALERGGAAPATHQPPAALHAVRWEPSLLTAETGEAVAAWETSLHGYCKRLGARERSAFLMGLDAPLYAMQGHAAVEAENGLHPKHRLMRYHDFFVERIAAGERTIDLGCGVGALAVSIAGRAGADVTGMDWSETNLGRARERAGSRGVAHRARFVLGDITSDRGGERFDAAVLSNVLEHITDRPERLRAWQEWYHPSRFLIRVPAFDRDWRVPWKKELGAEWRLDPTHETEYTEAELRRELTQAGLTVRELAARWGEYWCVAVPG